MKNNRPESLELLLRFGANVNQREGEGRTPLHILIGQWNKSGFEEFRWSYFDLLLSQPAIDINIQDNGEATPLELAVHKNLNQVVKKLFQAGAVVNQHVRRAMEVCTRTSCTSTCNKTLMNSRINYVGENARFTGRVSRR